MRQKQRLQPEHPRQPGGQNLRAGGQRLRAPCQQAPPQNVASRKLPRPTGGRPFLLLYILQLTHLPLEHMLQLAIGGLKAVKVLARPLMITSV